MADTRPPSADDDGFESWARTSARLLRRGLHERARIVREVGGPDRWKQADARWFAELRADVGEGRLDRVERYASICAQELDRRSGGEGYAPSPIHEIIGNSERAPKLMGEGNTELVLPDLDDELEAAEDALSWPIEKYAWLCAELEHAPNRAEDVWGNHGLGAQGVRRAVRRAWDKRLERDEELRARHDQLVKRYTEVRRGE